jgi:hypothetical protein
MTKDMAAEPSCGSSAADQCSREARLTIDYMPWAELKKEFAVGPVSFWPFKAKAQEKIADAGLRDHLTQFLAHFVDDRGKPIDPLMASTSGDWETIRSAVDCLIFVAIAEGVAGAVGANNPTIRPPSADRFDLCARWAQPSSDGGMAVVTDKSLGYWPSGEHRISRPPFAVRGFLGAYDGPRAPLLQSLARMFDSSFPSDVRQRLLRSFEWFRLAHTESTAVSPVMKVVMMATAFEVLLGLGKWRQAKHFRQAIEDEIAGESFVPETHPDDKGRDETFSRCAWWAYDFYGLRNAIVHGESVEPAKLYYKDWVTHLDVADVVMLEFVKRLLYKHGCLGSIACVLDESSVGAGTDSCLENVEATRSVPCRYAFHCAIANLPQDPNLPAEATEAALPASFDVFGLSGAHEALGWIPSHDEQEFEYGP